MAVADALALGLLSDAPQAAPGPTTALLRPPLRALVWIFSAALGLGSQPTNAMCLIARAASGVDEAAPLASSRHERTRERGRGGGAAGGRVRAGRRRTGPPKRTHGHPSSPPHQRRRTTQFCRALGARVPAALSAAPFARGVMRELVDRVRFFDARLAAALGGGGVSQVVVLAAGYDSSAYRLAAAHPGVRFFEVDLPSVSARKRALVEACSQQRGAGRAAGAAYVGADLAAAPLADALLPAGFDPRRPTAWLAQGLLCYVPAACVEALLRGVRALSAPGSVAVFDALDSRAVTPPGGWPSAPFELLKALTDARGETFRSCFDGARLPELARLLGFRHRFAEGGDAKWRAFGGMIRKVEWAVEE
jgi:methyltransferase (TIGR00027 family)